MDGYIVCFKQRHNICAGKIIGEASNVNEKNVKDWLDCTWKDVQENYAKDNVYNANETAIFCNLTPY